ncbi:hypothetical protein ACFL1M_00985 [Patescibacteria group bacterium]
MNDNNNPKNTQDNAPPSFGDVKVPSPPAPVKTPLPPTPAFGAPVNIDKNTEEKPEVKDSLPTGDEVKNKEEESKDPVIAPLPIIPKKNDEKNIDKKTKEEISPPKKEDMPVESKFPGQPIPKSDQEKLEKKAETVIADGGKPKNKTAQKKTVKVLLGALALLLVGSGVFVGNSLVQQDTDNRSQASDDHHQGSYYEGCDSGWYACNTGCCGVGGTENEGNRYSPLCGSPDDEDCTWNSNTTLDELREDPDLWQDILDEMQNNGLGINDNNGIVTVIRTDVQDQIDSNEYLQAGLDSGLCRVIAGGWVFCGNDGGYTDPCAPIIGGGGDWCQVLGGEGALCSDIGAVRCHCNNGQWVIGYADGCDDLCGGTNNICESCPPEEPPEEPPVNPGSHLECVDYACMNVAGDEADSCDDDLDCIPDSTLTCNSLQSTPNLPEIGDSVRFACSGSSSPDPIDHYNFEYSINNSPLQALAEDGKGSGNSVPLLIDSPGDYVVACQACRSSDESDCTNWQSAHVQ